MYVQPWPVGFHASTAEYEKVFSLSGGLMLRVPFALDTLVAPNVLWPATFVGALLDFWFPAHAVDGLHSMRMICRMFGVTVVRLVNVWRSDVERCLAVFSRC